MADYRVIDAQQLDRDLTSVANAIRSKTGTTKTLEFPEGFVSAQADVFDAGGLDWWNTFWDNFQKNGTRTRYDRGFAFSESWNDAIFYPKYDINCVASAGYLFGETKITNLKSRLEECGVKLDTSRATNLVEAFAWSGSITHIPAISFEGLTSAASYTFSSGSIVEIEKLILRSDGSNTFSGTFSTTSKLEQMLVEGVIGQNGFNVSVCTKLNKASITSIIRALSTTTSGLSVSLSLNAVKKAFETSSGTNNGNTSAAWTALANTRTNWTITLV